MGLRRFERYFLHNDLLSAGPDIAAACGISTEEVEKINAFLNELSVRTEFFYPSAIDYEARIPYHKLAEIIDGGDEGFIVRFYSPKFIQGKYAIDFERFNDLKKRGVFSPVETRQIEKLLRKLALINGRKSTLYQILQTIVTRQAPYLKTGNEKYLVPYTQKELSRAIEVDQSLVSRALCGRSVLTPGGQEKPLKFFFPSKKNIRKDIIREIIRSEKRPLTDNAIKALLKEKYDIDVSRRTVNACRKEM
jgi:hypothetical protein